MRGYSGKETSNINVSETISKLNEHNNEQNEDIFVRTRKGFIKRKAEAKTQKRSFKQQRLKDRPPNNQDQLQSEDHDYPLTPVVIENVSKVRMASVVRIDHPYCRLDDQCSEDSECGCKASLCSKCKTEILQIMDENEKLKNENAKLTESLNINLRQDDNFSFDKIKDSDSLVKLHTGLDNFKVFQWIFDQGKDKVPFLQMNKDKIPGPGRCLSPTNELLLTLMKLRLNLNSQFLGHMFGVSTSLVTVILSTWLPLLSLELKPLIYWPSREEAQRYYPDCFKKYKNVIVIIDCTEVPIQRPSLALANGQIYSSYKGRPTCKLLVACTPVGTVSFISNSAGGAMSDKRIVKESGILRQFQPGDTVLADRGFKIQELLLPNQVKLVITPFLKKKKQFTIEDDTRTKQVANARIHIECVIGRLKDFDILKCELPLDMVDLFDHIATVICALINLQEPIIPLQSQ